MDKQTLKRQLQQTAGKEFVNVTEIAKIVGVGRNTAREMLRGVDYVAVGKSKLYFVPDVAEVLMEKRQYS